MSALWPTLADLSHLQQWVLAVFGVAIALGLIGLGCIRLLEKIGDWEANRAAARYVADMERRNERRKFQAITGGRR